VSGETPEQLIDTTVAHSARRYDYWLGGKDNFAADRASGDEIAAAFPTVRTTVIENRRFLRRAVTYLARETGIRQFLDIGTGIPAANNTHEVAQAIAPDTRVVYVDNDPIVLVHARALLASAPEGETAYLDADFREPETILAGARATLDFDAPIGLMLIALLHFIYPEEGPYEHVRTLVDAMPAGSYLAMSHVTADYFPPEMREAAKSAPRTPGGFAFRSREEFARFFEGLELVEPGITSIARWRADNEEEPRPAVEEISCNGAVARIP
jgi:hypothetical protein